MAITLNQATCFSNLASPGQEEKAYRVHLYALVRVPVDVPSASSQVDAIAKAEVMSDLSTSFKCGEFAEEISSVLVDEVGAY